MDCYPLVTLIISARTLTISAGDDRDLGLDQNPIQGGVVMLLVAPCYRNYLPSAHPTYIPTLYIPTFPSAYVRPSLRPSLPTYLPTYLPTCLSAYYLPNNQPSNQPTYLHLYLPTYLDAYLPTPICYIPTNVPSYLPTILVTFVGTLVAVPPPNVYNNDCQHQDPFDSTLGEGRAPHIWR